MPTSHYPGEDFVAASFLWAAGRYFVGCQLWGLLSFRTHSVIQSPHSTHRSGGEAYYHSRLRR